MSRRLDVAEPTLDGWVLRHAGSNHRARLTSIGSAINMAARHSFNFAEALHLAIAGGVQGGLESDA